MYLHFFLTIVSVLYSPVIMGTLNLHMPSEQYTHKDIGPLLQTVTPCTDITNFQIVINAKSTFRSIISHQAIQMEKHRKAISAFLFSIAQPSQIAMFHRPCLLSIY